jgi:hypothetical protein
VLNLSPGAAIRDLSAHQLPGQKEEKIAGKINQKLEEDFAKLPDQMIAK